MCLELFCYHNLPIYVAEVHTEILSINNLNIELVCKDEPAKLLIQHTMKWFDKHTNNSHHTQIIGSAMRKRIDMILRLEIDILQDSHIESVLLVKHWYDFYFGYLSILMLTNYKKLSDTRKVWKLLHLPSVTRCDCYNSSNGNYNGCWVWYESREMIRRCPPLANIDNRIYRNRDTWNCLFIIQFSLKKSNEEENSDHFAL